MNAADVQGLDTRGFVLIPSFLSQDEVAICREDFTSQPVNKGNRNYNLSPSRGKAHETLDKRVREVLDLVSTSTSLRVNLPLGGAYFATGLGIEFPWHQDHESFFAIQNHHDYLNFYIPIVKPRKDKSNLCVVPFDVLEKESPRTFRKLVRGGATRFSRIGDQGVAFLDDTGAVHLMKKDLERVAHTPQLEPGDLLLMRGDVIHRTQDTETERVSLSFRAANAETPVHRSRLADGGLMKAWMMMNNAETYERMFHAFDVAGRPAVGLAELNQTIADLPRSEEMGRKRFFRYLLRQKRRERVLGRFFRTSFTTLLATVAAQVSERRRLARAARLRP